MNSRPAYVALVALPFEVSTSFLKGTIDAPSAILDELNQLDSFDLSLGYNPFTRYEIKVVHAHGPEVNDPRLQQASAYRVVREILSQGGFPLSLGGEHTVSIGPIRAARRLGPLGIVQVDAHADLRDNYEGNSLSHACAMRRATELNCSLLSIGTRAICEEEFELLKSRRALCVKSRQALKSRDWYELLEKLPEHIYLTIDMDGFDPSCVPDVGTPEPGGLLFEQVGDFLKHLFHVKKVIAADIVELMPTTGWQRACSVRLAVRLAGLIVGLR